VSPGLVLRRRGRTATDAVVWSHGSPTVAGPAGDVRLAAVPGAGASAGAAPEAGGRGGEPASPGWTDPWGIPEAGLRRAPALVTDLAFLVELHSPGCPFGPLRSTVLVRGDGTVRSDLWGPLEARDRTNVAPLALEGPYALLLGWLHRQVIFGNLVWAGAGVTGDLLDFVAVDGIVSAPSPDAEPAVVGALFDLLPEALGGS
jgi:hypothetical protein